MLYCIDLEGDCRGGRFESYSGHYNLVTYDSFSPGLIFSLCRICVISFQKWHQFSKQKMYCIRPVLYVLPPSFYLYAAHGYPELKLPRATQLSRGGGRRMVPVWNFSSIFIASPSVLQVNAGNQSRQEIVLPAHITVCRYAQMTSGGHDRRVMIPALQHPTRDQLI